MAFIAQLKPPNSSSIANSSISRNNSPNSHELISCFIHPTLPVVYLTENALTAKTV